MYAISMNLTTEMVTALSIAWTDANYWAQQLSSDPIESEKRESHAQNLFDLSVIVEKLAGEMGFKISYDTCNVCQSDFLAEELKDLNAGNSYARGIQHLVCGRCFDSYDPTPMEQWEVTQG
jgi:hypothetical protein